MEKYKECDIHSLCRTCLEILSESRRKYHLFLTPDLAKKLIVCTSLEVESHDVFPKNLCDACVHKVDELHQFQKMCMDSLQTYKEILAFKTVTNSTKFEEIQFEEKEEFELELTKTEPINSDDDENMDRLEFKSNVKVKRISSKGNLKQNETPTEKNSSPQNTKNYKDSVKDGSDEESTSFEESIDANREFLSDDGSSTEGGEEEDDNEDKDQTFTPLNKNNTIRNRRNKTDDTSAGNTNKSSEKSKRMKQRRIKKLKTIKESMVYKCDNCPKRFFVEHRLIAHKRTHDGLMPYPCSYPNCDKAFNRWHCLSEHIKQHEGTNRWYTCEEEGCGKIYKHKPTLAMHLRKFHKKGPELKSHVCEICGKVFKAMRILQAHKFIHKDKSEFPFVCPEDGCDRRFAGREKLKIHLMRHAGIKNYVCPYCGMRKTTRNELKIHINYHTLERTWPCRFCPHVCNSAGNLKMHVRTVHERAKDYACRFCEKTFAKPDTRKYHEMTHTGEKPNECEQCGKRFIQPAALRTHRKIHLKHKLKAEATGAALAAVTGVTASNGDNTLVTSTQLAIGGVTASNGDNTLVTSTQLAIGGGEIPQSQLR